MINNKEAENRYRLARSTMNQDEVGCNYCGFIWEPTSLREETLCPSCRRNPSKEYPNAPLGDVSYARVRGAQERAAKALEAKSVNPAKKAFAKKVNA